MSEFQSVRTPEIEVDRSAWIQVGDTWVHGSGHLDGSLRTGESLAEIVDGVATVDEFQDVLEELNGFFSIITIIDGKVALAVDRVSSTPLFYTISNGVIVSAHSTVLQERVPEEYDSEVVEEYLHLGYVTGQETLHKRISQCKRGQLVVLDPAEECVSDTRQYHSMTFDGDQEPDIKEMEAVLEEVAERIVEYAGGETITIGLSGGLDSRVMAIMLARTGYDDIVTYTYGLSTFTERSDIRIARRVADEMGLEHHVIEPTHQDFLEFRESDRWDEYLDQIDVLGSVPNVHDTVILSKLRELADVSANPVDIRGHIPTAADPHAPRFFPADLAETDDYRKERLARDVKTLHMRLWEGDRTGIIDSILQSTPEPAYLETDTEPGEVAAKCYNDIYAERTAKYLSYNQETNFLNYREYYPFWDARFVSYYLSLNLKHLVEGRFWDEFVRRLSEDEFGTTNLEPADEEQNSSLLDEVMAAGWDVAVTMIDRLPDSSETAIRHIYRRYLSDFNRTWESNPEFGLVTQDEFERYDMPYRHPEAFYFLVICRDTESSLQTHPTIEGVLPE